MKSSSALLLLLLAALPGGAIELSLEENRAQRGNIGYVDMQRIFKLFPETIRAKENFEEAVRQAEEQINLGKADIIRLRSELTSLRLEREALAKVPGPPPAAAPVPAPVPEAPKVALSTPTEIHPSLSSETVARLLAGATYFDDVAVASAPVNPLIINLPGVTTGFIPTPRRHAEPAPPLVPVPLPAPAAAPKSPADPSPALAELDEKISNKMMELAQKEISFKEHQATAEKNLLGLESRKTEILLGKIQRVVKEVARQEGVSVVVDKNSILFGHDAVDLTERVLKALKDLK